MQNIIKVIFFFFLLNFYNCSNLISYQITKPISTAKMQSEKFEESEICKIFPNEFFGYTKVVIEQPLTDDNGEIITDKKGDPKPNTKKRDYERVPLEQDIDDYYEREVKPHLPDSWMDRNKDKVGYEINFTKYFYKYKPLRSLGDITQDLLKLDEQIGGTMKEILD